MYDTFSAAQSSNRFTIILQTILQIVFISDTPLKLSGFDKEPFLCIGQIILSPHDSGTIPSENTVLNTVVKNGKI